MDDVLAASFSPDGGRIVTGSGDSTVRIWDAASGAPIAVLTGHLGAVYSAAFSPDGNRILSAAHDATGRIWTRLPAADMPAASPASGTRTSSSRGRLTISPAISSASCACRTRTASMRTD